MSSTSSELMFIRAPEVCRRTGLSKATLWRMERRGVFPRHHRISTNAVAWLSADVDAWVQQRVAMRHRAAAENEKFLNAREVQREYVLPIPTLRNWVARNLLNPVMVNGEVRFSTRDIERLLGIA